MTQDERRLYLIQALLKELPQYAGVAIPGDESGQQQLLRSLFNLRPPLPADEAFLKIQDAYLSQRVRERGTTDAASLVPSEVNPRIFLWQGDITTLKCDAIVNAANSALLGCFQPCHSCIDNIIHTFSGVQLRLRCHELMKAQGHPEPTGTAKITPGYNLPCQQVLHTVGPIVSGPLQSSDCDLLAQCYRSCLELAVAHGVKSLTFCCISTGVFHFPQDQAARIALESVSTFLKTDQTLQQVIFNVFTDTDFNLYKQLLTHTPPTVTHR
ncbi:MAG: protein-ADP-ribose hydrolase [Eubacterium aggregans]|uniref:protein-ADP-ribose hydrolase n=1 Tax=Eubacterium aggregans TaxID=81409 RepID=UPI002B203546|nr:protein-ADP-ribose hydrolase [Eubacterium aggregans]MEA5073028.1 protein-ADP-ribose hydrolase [Eubacterium aggregans]